MIKNTSQFYHDNEEIPCNVDCMLDNPFCKCCSTDDLIEFSPIDKPCCTKKRRFEVEVTFSNEEAGENRRFSITKTKTDVENLFVDLNVNTKKKSRISVEVSLSSDECVI